MSKRLYEILIPVNANDNDTKGTFYVGDGWRFSREHHFEFETKLVGLSGGMTRYPETLGVWIDKADGQMYTEKMIPYRVVCTAKEIEDLAEFAKTHYKQITICVFEIGTAKIY